MPITNRAIKLLYVLTVLRIIIPYFIQNAVYEPHRDEFLYLAEGQHLAWGFMEVPPILSLFAWLTKLLGGGLFWIKLWPSLFGAATFFVAGKTVLSLGGRSFALCLLFLSLFIGAYLRVFFLFQPNAPEVFFWTMVAFSLLRFIQTNDHRWFYVLGISCGLGMMSKYSVAFFIVSMLGGLIVTKQRRVLKNRHFWLGALIGLIIFAPNIVWQYTHGLPVFHHMKELQRTQLQYISPATFLVGQLMMNLAVVFIWLVGLIYILLSKRAANYRFIGIAYLLVLAIFVVAHGKGYYALGAYPVLFAFGATRLEQLTQLKMKWLRVAFVLIPLVLGYFVVPIMLPIFPPAKLASYYERMHTKKTGALKWEDLNNHPLPQDFADMLGWEEMAQKMAKAYGQLDNSEQEHTMLFCDNYGMAGAVSFYGKKYDLPLAYSANASFLYWLPVNLHVDNLVLITDDKDEMQHPFIKNFKSANVIDSITTPFARERGDLVILLKGANDIFNQWFKQKIDEERAAFK